MRLVTIEGIDPDSIAKRVPARTYADGLVQAPLGASGTWRGTTTTTRSTPTSAVSRRPHEVGLVPPGRREALAFLGGECTCPVGIDCAHVVAAAVTAARPRPGRARGAAGGRVGPRPRRPARARRARDRPAAARSRWRSSCRCAAPGRTAGSGRGLTARLVRPGRTGWVAGGLSWSRLGSPYQAEEYRPEHLRLLRELYALHRSQTATTALTTPDDRTVELDRFDSPRLWALLDEADAIGLQVVHARKRLGPVVTASRVELRLDVTAAGGGGLEVAPVLHLDPAGSAAGGTPAVHRRVRARGRARPAGA